MLKKTVTFTDFDDNPGQSTLYFNLTKTEVMDMFDLYPRLQAWQDRGAQPDDEMSTDDIREILSIVRMLVEKAYGVRTEGGKRFTKNSSILEDFKASPEYDALIYGMFVNTQEAIDFIMNILPKDLSEDARQHVAQNTSDTPVETRELPEAPSLAVVPEPEDHVAVEQEVPLYVREQRPATQSELQAMSRQDMLAAWAFREKLEAVKRSEKEKTDGASQ